MADPRRMCPHCRAFITTKDRVCPYCGETVGPRAADREGTPLLGGFVPHARFVTVMILLINFALYVATALWSMKSGGGAMDVDGRTLLLCGGKWGPGLAAGQWWRCCTSS
jgi:rhomboid protease GluP